MADYADYALGAHRVVVTGTELGATPKNSTPYYRVFFEPQTFVDPVTRKETAVTGTGKRSATYWLTEKAFPYLKTALNELGLGEVKDWTQLQSGGVIDSKLVGKKLLAFNNGKKKDSEYDEWRLYTAGTNQSTSQKELDDAAKAKLNALFGTVPTTTTAAAPTNRPSKDCPF